jgi:hypothetical protein
VDRPPCRFLLMLACALTISCTAPSAQDHPSHPSAAFRNPQRVTMEGYDDDAMEPFVSRDGRYLFFNNLNEPQVDTNLHWAERVDDLHFKNRGEIRGVNTPALEASPRWIAKATSISCPTAAMTRPLRLCTGESLPMEVSPHRTRARCLAGQAGDGEL